MRGAISAVRHSLWSNLFGSEWHMYNRSSARARLFYGCFVAVLTYTRLELMVKRKRLKVKRIRKTPRAPDNVVCPGCARPFVMKHQLKAHLGQSRWNKYLKGTLSARACVGNAPCKLYQTISAGARPRARDRQKAVACMSTEKVHVVVLRRPAGGVAVVRPGSRARALPPCIVDIHRVEREGIDGGDVEAGVADVATFACVKEYVRDETRVERNALYRFLLLALYSMHARVSFALRGLYFSESTVAIGIGDVGLARVDDVYPFFGLYASLCVSFDRMRDRILWVLVAHMLVRPGVIEALRNLVCGRGLVPSVDTSTEVLGAFGAAARSHPQSYARGAAGLEEDRRLLRGVHTNAWCQVLWLAQAVSTAQRVWETGAYCGRHVRPSR